MHEFKSMADRGSPALSETIGDYTEILQVPPWLLAHEPLQTSYWTGQESEVEAIEIVSNEQGRLDIAGLEAGLRYDLFFAHPDFADTPATVTRGFHRRGGSGSLDRIGP